jgi:3-oxoacyl-(acyl-carrier-protein) synthase
MTAPVASVTVPLRTASCACATSGNVIKAATRINRVVSLGFIRVLLALGTLPEATER